MDEMKQPNPAPESAWPPAPPPAPALPAGRREAGFAGAVLVIALLMANCVLMGGFQLGFALTAAASLIAGWVYLRSAGRRPGWYENCLLGLSVAIALGFARADDGFVKFILLLFLLVGGNLGLCLAAGQNSRRPGSAASVLDAPRAAWTLGIGKISPAMRGLFSGLRAGGRCAKSAGAVLLGAVIAAPLLAIVIALLASADAAFDSLMGMLPEFDLSQLVLTAIFGVLLFGWLYTRGVALGRGETPAAAEETPGRLSPLTVNTVLGAVAAVYAVYLFSQLGYLSGGFAGILPEGYTPAQYARRGFFELAVLCGINLGILALGIGLVRKQPAAPRSTRVLCLVVGLATLFLAAAESAKMLLYIRAFGLTRLRVLTEVITLWLGLTTLMVMIWLFAPKFPYMRAVMRSAMVLGCAVLWTDVDTLVASYNVSAYQSGALAEIDLDYLGTLSSGALPAIARLTEDADPTVAAGAKAILANAYVPSGDLRSWNWADSAARSLLGGLSQETAE